jgi:C-terminal processing protease CtpA/Prc
MSIENNMAVLTVNSFSKGHLKTFFRQSFRTIKKERIKNVVIDLRANGGGEINNYVALAKYITNTKFKVADTAMAAAKNFGPYTKYIKQGFFNNIGLFFLTKKKKDGLYHFTYWEKHLFKPKGNLHFDGNTYVITNGLTFSASSLFCNAVKGQQNVTLVGENTGGGWYGNSGIMIPDIVLPNTKLRVRLPVFRLVQYHHVATKGTGVIPDVYVGPTLESVRKSSDPKMEMVKKMIAEGRSGGK